MPASRKRAEPERAHPLTLDEWRAWLRRHHARDEGVWLVSYKKASGKPRLEYEAAVEEALAFGWIDSKPNTLDAARSMLWFAPRKPGTGWSRINKARVERLLAAGRMQPPGLAKVEAAKADGSWGRLDAVDALVLPDDLVAALARHANARRRFDAFPRSAKRGILEWIVNAKRLETRAKRIEETAQLAARNERANQWARGDRGSGIGDQASGIGNQGSEGGNRESTRPRGVSRKKGSSTGI